MAAFELTIGFPQDSGFEVTSCRQGDGLCLRTWNMFSITLLGRVMTGNKESLARAETEALGIGCDFGRQIMLTRAITTFEAIFIDMLIPLS